MQDLCNFKNLLHVVDSTGENRWDRADDLVNEEFVMQAWGVHLILPESMF